MKIEFEEEYLEELFTDGKTTNRKVRLQQSVINQYIKTVNALISAPDTETLYKLKFLHYEKKSGNLKDIEAVWVNTQYRLEFRTRKEGSEPNIITICSLQNLSNHYKR
jgi:proteic killer suppression protein